MVVMLNKAISKNNTNGKVEVREVVNFLAEIPGRYQCEAVVK
jgi:hypothetical protein